MGTPTIPGAVDQRVRAGSRNWLRVRGTGIGASEIGAVLGLSPYQSRFSLYHLKRGDLPETLETERMEFGKRLEDVVLRRFLDEYGGEFPGATLVKGRLFRSASRPWQLATPDATLVRSDGAPVTIECKTANRPNDRDERHRWGADGSDDIPLFYRCQVLQAADVMGAAVAYVPVLFGGSRFRCYRIHVDPAEVRILRAKGREFWADVLEGREPEPDGSGPTSSALRTLYLEDTADPVEVPRREVEMLNTTKALLKRAEALHNLHENRVRALMGDAPLAVADGLGVVATRSTWNQDRFDTKRFQRDHPDVYSKYLVSDPRARLNWKGNPT